MSRRARSRRDRRVILNTMAFATESARKLRPDGRAELQQIIDGAAERFRAGTNAERGCAWRTLADALNTAEALCGMGIASDAASRERIDAAQAVLAAAWQSSDERGTWSLHAAELQALDDGLWVHGVQLDHCSLGEFERARRLVAERVRHALAGNMPAGTRICDGATT